MRESVKDRVTRPGGRVRAGRLSFLISRILHATQTRSILIAVALGCFKSKIQEMKETASWLILTYGGRTA